MLISSQFPFCREAFGTGNVFAFIAFIGKEEGLMQEGVWFPTWDYHITPTCIDLISMQEVSIPINQYFFFIEKYFIYYPEMISINNMTCLIHIFKTGSAVVPHEEEIKGNNL